MAKWLLLLMLAMTAIGVTGRANSQILVDLELVLAVDISSSMDKDEQRLQRDGYVAALRHPAIVGALTSGSIGRIALTYFEWGNQISINTVLEWTLLENQADVLAAADILARAPIGTAQSTSISGALAAAALMIGQNGFSGTRRVIDISGDGPNNVGGGVLAARQAVLAMGIEINGLPILIKKGRGGFQIDNLDLYYRECVIGGPSAFVIAVYDKKRMASTILQKLVLEMADLAPKRSLVRLVANDVGNNVAKNIAKNIDCMIGERQRDDFMRSLGFE